MGKILRSADAVLQSGSRDLSRYARPNIRARKCIGLTYQVVKQTVNQLSGIELNRANNSRRRVVYCERLPTRTSPATRFSLFQSECSHSVLPSSPLSLFPAPSPTRFSFLFLPFSWIK